MTPSITSSVTNVGPESASLLAEMHAVIRGFGAERPWTADEFAALLKGPSGRAFLACVSDTGDATGDEPAGFAIAHFAGRDGDLLFIGVLPRFMRRGLGRHLLRVMLDQAGAAGLERLLLEVAEDNHAARALYAAAGFTLVGQRPDYYRRQDGGSVDALVMQHDF